MLSLLGDKATNSYMLALLSELSKQEITAHPQSKAANLAIAVTQSSHCNHAGNVVLILIINELNLNRIIKISFNLKLVIFLTSIAEYTLNNRFRNI